MGILIQNGTVVTADRAEKADVLVEGSTIREVRAQLDPAGHTVVDATGLLVLPGGVDAHTHMDMPFGGTVSADDFLTGTRAAARPRIAPATCRPPGVAGSGSPFSLGDLLQHRLIELRLREELLQPAVLTLKLLELLRVVGLHATELVPPPVIRLRRHLEMAGDFVDVFALGEEPVGLAQLPDHLLRRVPASLHDRVLPAHTIVGEELSHQVDQPEGLRSALSRSSTRLSNETDQQA